jgi:hypothetical protein
MGEGEHARGSEHASYVLRGVREENEEERGEAGEEERVCLRLLTPLLARTETRTGELCQGPLPMAVRVPHLPRRREAS